MAVLDKATILGNITVLLADNTSGDITAGDVRSIFVDSVDSSINKIDDTTDNLSEGIINLYFTDERVSLNSSVVANTAKISATTANIDAAGAVMDSDFNANTILKADVDDTPTPLVVGPSTLIGRNSTGGVDALSVSDVQSLIGITPVASATVAGATVVDFVDVIDSTADLYILVWSELVCTSDAAELWLRTSSDNGISFDATIGNYAYSLIGKGALGLVEEKGSDNASRIVISDNIGNASGENGSGSINIWSPANASIKTMFGGISTSMNNLGSPQSDMVAGVRDSLSAVNAIRVVPSSGTISGKFYLYKVVK